MKRAAYTVISACAIAACTDYSTANSPDGADAGTTSGANDGGAINHEDGAAVAMDSGADAGADAANSDASSLACTHFTDDFQSSPWSSAQAGWMSPPQAPYFSVPSAINQHGVFQSSTAGPAATPTLVHAITPGCDFHLTLSVKTDDASNNLTLTFLRIPVSTVNLDFIRTPSGVLQVAYGGMQPKVISQFNAGTNNVLDVQIPATAGAIKITWNAVSSLDAVTLPAIATKITQFSVGIVDASSNANVTFELDVDDVAVP